MSDLPPAYDPNDQYKGGEPQVAYPSAPPQQQPMQGYPPQQQSYQQQPYQQQPYQQQPYQQQPMSNNNPDQIARDQARDARRAREREQNKCMAGLCCGGCFIILCVGRERAVACGTSVMDRLLCMDVCFGGF